MSTDAASKMTTQQAEAVWDELLCTSDRQAIDAVFRRAVMERKTPIGVLITYGDPREES